MNSNINKTCYITRICYKNKKFFIEIKKLIKTHPYFAVILIHEYFRNLYPTDPSISFKIKDPVKRINFLLDDLIKISKIYKSWEIIKLLFLKLKKRVKISNIRPIWKSFQYFLKKRKPNGQRIHY